MNRILQTMFFKKITRFSTHLRQYDTYYKEKCVLIKKYRENVSDAIFRHILQKLFFFFKKNSLERQKGSEQDGGLRATLCDVLYVKL